MKVNEIFCSLQGEGYFTGTPAVFVRLSGCNLNCDFCDTRHQDGIEMSDDEIVSAVMQYKMRHVVVTGGEPTLQLTETLVDELHRGGCFVQIETNGTQIVGERLLSRIDWITCSPKFGMTPIIGRIDELKVIFDVDHPEYIENISEATLAGAKVLCLQPCDRSESVYNKRNLSACIDYILSHPRWRLSLQTHKMLGLR